MNLVTSDPSGRLRFFLGGLAHETNSFSPLPTTIETFAAGLLHRPGDTATASGAAQFPGYGDFLAVATERGDEVIPGMMAWAQPSGPLSRRDYESLRDEMLAELRAALPVDAVCLLLHGAMLASGYPDCEGDLLQHVRAVVGPTLPIGALLDLHGNTTASMTDSGAVLVACKEYPHTDYRARAEELHVILADAARGGTVPRSMRHRVPMLGLFGTTDGPMHDFVRSLPAYENRDGILSVSAMHGFAWSDTADTSGAIIVVHDSRIAGTAARAVRVADELGAAFWSLRDRIPQRRLPLDQALDEALAAGRPEGPVVLADGSDNPGGGAACDSTFVLCALLERGVVDAALGMIWDPVAAGIAASAGVGARLAMRIGGKIGPMSGTPIDAEVEVLAVRHDGTQRGLDGRMRDPLGLAVALRIGGVDVVVNSLRQQVFSPDCFSELGIDPMTKRLLVVKSTQHFRASFDPIVSATVYCDAPGSLNSDLAALPFRHLTRPIWPLDDIVGGPQGTRHEYQ